MIFQGYSLIQSLLIIILFVMILIPLITFLFTCLCQAWYSAKEKHMSHVLKGLTEVIKAASAAGLDNLIKMKGKETKNECDDSDPGT